MNLQQLFSDPSTVVAGNATGYAFDAKGTPCDWYGVKAVQWSLYAAYSRIHKGCGVCEDREHHYLRLKAAMPPAFRNRTCTPLIDYGREYTARDVINLVRDAGV